MSAVTQLEVRLNQASFAPHEVNAVLFYHLAQFVVWTQAHTELVATYPDLQLLLQRSTTALSRGGILEHPPGSLSRPVTIPVSDSENMASGPVPGEERHEA